MAAYRPGLSQRTEEQSSNLQQTASSMEQLTANHLAQTVAVFKVAA